MKIETLGEWVKRTKALGYEKYAISYQKGGSMKRTSSKVTRYTGRKTTAAIKAALVVCGD